MNLARKYEHQVGANAIDLDKIAVQKDQNWDEEKTIWIFEDGSAISISGNVIGIINDYGLHPDYEQLK